MLLDSSKEFLVPVWYHTHSANTLKEFIKREPVESLKMFPSSNLVIISMSYMHDNQAFQTQQTHFPLLKRRKVKGVSKCLKRVWNCLTPVYLRFKRGI